MWVDYRGSLSTVYKDGEISTCGEIIEVHSVQSTKFVTSVIRPHIETSLSLHTQSSYLNSFSLSGAGRSSRCSSELEVEGSSEGQVTPVCEGRDHQTARVPEVLVAVHKLGIHSSYQ